MIANMKSFFGMSGHMRMSVGATNCRLNLIIFDAFVGTRLRFDYTRQVGFNVYQIDNFSSRRDDFAGLGNAVLNTSVAGGFEFGVS